MLALRPQRLGHREHAATGVAVRLGMRGDKNPLGALDQLNGPLKYFPICHKSPSIHLKRGLFQKQKPPLQVRSCVDYTHQSDLCNRQTHSTSLKPGCPPE